MGSTDFGNFHGFCQEATLPVCNLFSARALKGGDGNGTGEFEPICELTGIPLSNDRHLTNLGSIIICGFAVLISFGLFFLSERKKAAVGRREMQLFLTGYAVVSICEIFTVGGIPLKENVVLGFTAVHLAAIAATTWMLMLNGLVGFQLLDDGTAMSILLVLGSAAAIFVGTGYIALDTAFSITGHFDSSFNDPNNPNIALYVLYWLLPLVCLVVFFCLETILVLRVLGERKPMLYLIGAAILFALGQIFQFTISKYICQGTSGKINGSLFETLFTLLSVVAVWVFWSSITEDDWPVPMETSTSTPYG